MGERFNIEDQVGGLIDHDRPSRRRGTRRAPAAPLEAREPLETPEPERYQLTARPRPRIHAERASDAAGDRRVA